MFFPVEPADDVNHLFTPGPTPGVLMPSVVAEFLQNRAMGNPVSDILLPRMPDRSNCFAWNTLEELKLYEHHSWPVIPYSPSFFFRVRTASLPGRRIEFYSPQSISPGQIGLAQLFLKTGHPQFPTLLFSPECCDRNKK